MRGLVLPTLNTHSLLIGEKLYITVYLILYRLVCCIDPSQKSVCHRQTVMERQVCNKRAGSSTDGFLLYCTPCQVSKRANRATVQDRFKQLPANLIHRVVPQINGIVKVGYRQVGVDTGGSQRNDCPEWSYLMVVQIRWITWRTHNRRSC